jgi:hypothetical protein
MVKLEIEITDDGKLVRVKCSLFEVGEATDNERDCASKIGGLMKELVVDKLLRNPQDRAC